MDKQIEKKFHFTKYQSNGNDFVIFDGISTYINFTQQQIQQLGNRNFGIGFDQLLILLPPKNPDSDFSIAIHNSDGSKAEQCGNGIKALAAFIRMRNYADKQNLALDLDVETIQIEYQDNNLVTLEVGSLARESAAFPKQKLLKENSYTFEKQKLHYVAVDIGNPHVVFFVKDVEHYPLEDLARVVQEDTKNFPQSVNVNVAQLLDEERILLRVFERGTGETLSCGSGCAASVAAAMSLKLIDETSTVEVMQKGGINLITKSQKNNQVMLLTGESSLVYKGIIQLEVSIPNVNQSDESQEFAEEGSY